MKELIESNSTLPGWCDISKAISLFNLVRATRPITIVEVGVFGGRSAIPMMMACKLNGRGVVHCVDPWSAKISTEGQIQDIDREWWGNLNHDDIFQGFQNSVERLGLKSQCAIHRMTAKDFEIPGFMDVAHIDGNHGPDALADTIKFGSKISDGGYVILDDCNWSGGYVVKSAEWLLANGFIQLHPLGTGAVFHKL